MSNQLNLLVAPETETEDPWEKEYTFNTPKKYWEELVPGEICKVTPRWGGNRLCILIKIIEEVFGEIKYLDNGKPELISLCCLVPASPEEVEADGC